MYDFLLGLVSSKSWVFCLQHRCISADITHPEHQAAPDPNQNHKIDAISANVLQWNPGQHFIASKTEEKRCIHNVIEAKALMGLEGKFGDALWTSAGVRHCYQCHKPINISINDGISKQGPVNNDLTNLDTTDY